MIALLFGRCSSPRNWKKERKREQFEKNESPFAMRDANKLLQRQQKKNINSNFTRIFLFILFGHWLTGMRLRCIGVKGFIGNVMRSLVVRKIVNWLECFQFVCCWTLNKSSRIINGLTNEWTKYFVIHMARWANHALFFLQRCKR